MKTEIIAEIGDAETRACSLPPRRRSMRARRNAYDQTNHAHRRTRHRFRRRRLVGQKNPQAAANLSKQEEQQVIEKALALNEQIKAKLEQMNKAQDARLGFSQLRLGARCERHQGSRPIEQEAELQAHLAKLKSK